MSGIVGDINSKSRVIERPSKNLFRSYLSADDVLSKNSNATNGVYWIDVEGGGPIRVLCDFTTVSDGSSQAGGYMLCGRFTDMTASVVDWQNSGYSCEYDTNPDACMSYIREVKEFRYLRIAWNGSSGTSAPIYDLGDNSGGLVIWGTVAKARVSSGTGSTGELTTSNWGALGTLDRDYIYINRPGADHRSVLYSNYEDDSQNQDGMFSTSYGIHSSDGGIIAANSNTTAITWLEFWIK